MFQCKYHLYQSSFVHSPELVCKHDSHVTGILKADWPDVKNKTINSHATKNGPYVCLSVCLSACIFQRPNDQTSPNLCALHVAGVTHGSVILWQYVMYLQLCGWRHVVTHTHTHTHTVGSVTCRVYSSVLRLASVIADATASISTKFCWIIKIN